MSIFQHRIALKSLESLSGGRRGYAAASGEYFVNIQPLDAVTAIKSGYAADKTFKVYSQSTVIPAKVTDKIIDLASNEEYTVKGVKKYTLAGQASHSEITVESN